MSLHPPVGPDDHAQGPADAPVTLVEYADYQCSFCGAAYPVLKELARRFDGRLRFVFRNFPIPELHPQAMAAATAAEYCASKGEFWAAHDDLFEHQSALGEALYERIAETVGAGAAGVRQAVAADQFHDRIESDIESGLRSGVNGTPSFYLNGRKVEIRQSFEELFDAVEQELAAGPGATGP